jgi:hypothetical protein
MHLIALCTFVCGLFSAAKGQPSWPSEVDTFDLRLRTLLVGNTGQPDDSSIISVAQVLVCTAAHTDLRLNQAHSAM